MKYIIIGRAGTGTFLFQERLVQFGLKPLFLSTNRPKTGAPEDQFCKFLSADQTTAIPADQKLCMTNTGSSETFTLKADLMDADVMVLPPASIWDAINALPDEIFHIIHVMVDDPNQIDTFVTKGAANPQQALNELHAQQQSENASFERLEKIMDKSKQDRVPLAPNATTIIDFKNDFADMTLDRYAGWLAEEMTLFRNIMAILEHAAALGVVTQDDKNRCRVMGIDGADKFVDPQYFAELVLNDDESFARLIKAYLSCHVNIGIPEELLVDDQGDEIMNGQISFDNLAAQQPTPNQTAGPVTTTPQQTPATAATVPASQTTPAYAPPAPFPTNPAVPLT